MLKIKLTRIGKKNVSDYRIVVAEARSKHNGQYLDLIGNYQPQAKPAAIRFNREKLNQWLRQGAQPTDTVRRLITKYGSTA